MAERDEFGAFLIGFIIGGLTGAAVSLLLAPQSGEDTREYLRDQAIVLRDKAQETAQTTYDTVGTRATDVRTKANELADKARTGAHDFADKAKAGAQDLAQRGQVVLDEGKAKISSLRTTQPQDDEGETAA